MENGERKVRHADVGMADIAGVARAVQDMYDDRLDVLIVRGALDATRLAALGEQLDRDDRDPGWARPNQRMPVEDIQLLGTDTPATPTYQSPRGASLDDYLQSAERNKSTTTALFGEGYNSVDWSSQGSVDLASIWLPEGGADIHVTTCRRAGSRDLRVHQGASRPVSHESRHAALAVSHASLVGRQARGADPESFAAAIRRQPAQQGLGH